MGKIPDFIGLGAQKAGTSWIYSCLYEHPQVCMPVKEIHFFSRERNWIKGYEWYEQIFEQCPSTVETGEFATSYLADPLTPQRIYERYPNVKLIASLRNPVDRAYSNYINDIKAGLVPQGTPFEHALQSHPEYLEQGRYATQVRRYLEFFPKDQILLLIYEDCLRQPLAFLREIYKFLEIDTTFVPSMLHKRINVSQVPRFVWLERWLIRAADVLQHSALRPIWWFVKKRGMANVIRNLNRSSSENTQHDTSEASWESSLYQQLEGEIKSLEGILGRRLQEWRG